MPVPLAKLPLLALTTFAGFGIKFSGVDLFQFHLAGLVYVVFLVLFADLLFPRIAVPKLAAWVLAVTCLLEFAQLWKPPALQAVRGTFLGRALLGDTFSWDDFPFYVAGALIGGLWTHFVRIWISTRSSSRP